jgi:ribosomal protein S12 methylthiotransferase accessory factor
MPPISGSGCHPRRQIALLRALTEAAQGRLTMISGSRDDLSGATFDDGFALASGDRMRELISDGPADHPFCRVPDADHATFDADVQWELGRLSAAGVREVIAVNLTMPEFDVPVVRVVIPYLEAMSEVPNYVPGARARRKLGEIVS